MRVKDHTAFLRRVALRTRSWISAKRRRSHFRGSRDYWEHRYAGGGHSGAGSRGTTAAWKAEVISRLLAEHDVERAVEFGCGDGYQLGLIPYPRYIGLDVSATAIEQCRQLYGEDTSKIFEVYDPANFDVSAVESDLALSLDVILHLVEDPVFETHMRHVFAAATRLVVIFAPDEDTPAADPHVRYRRFTPWVEQNEHNWELVTKIENPRKGLESIADFFVFERASTPQH